MTAIQDQVILVTGSTDGIGKQTAYDFAKMGATVLLHGRNRERAEVTLQEIFAATGNNRLEYYLADFSSLTDVRHLAEAVRFKHRSLNILINNAGIGAGNLTNKQRALSQDGYELRLAVNYLAPFLLTHLLLPCLQQAVPSRIINVASVGQQPIDFENVMQEQQYNPMQAYCQSKIAGVMFTFDLAEQLKNKGITVNCLNPGSRLNTKMVREMFGEYRGSVQSGADEIIYVATSHELEGVTGKYFDQKQEAQSIAQAYDRKARQKLWQLSKSLCNL
ncbi:MAG: SDR family NAD(P)-dependent oxidoreductase [Iphinoe sp. HA4291-MV1]|jgi:NAD(P)-dependent dehydrogenase (short-subunit alcohol dehydrogenase family)|nr:SDR family NAD(P)-dependent oxidoreductase [Iphinoe sp. HA4291-MV1]